MNCLCSIHVALIVHLHILLFYVSSCLLFVRRCHECDKLEVEFAEAAAILKNHDPPVFFAQVCC